VTENLTGENGENRQKIRRTDHIKMASGTDIRFPVTGRPTFGCWEVQA
jgi:hypothetical protein